MTPGTALRTTFVLGLVTWTRGQAPGTVFMSGPAHPWRANGATMRNRGGYDDCSSGTWSCRADGAGPLQFCGSYCNFSILPFRWVRRDLRNARCHSIGVFRAVDNPSTAALADGNTSPSRVGTGQR